MYEFKIPYRGFILGVAVSHYSPGTKDEISLPMEDCHEGDPEEIEWEMLFVTVDDDLGVPVMFEEGFTISREEVEGIILETIRAYLS